MIIKHWSKDEIFYDLHYGFSLEKAVNTEFAKYHAAYLNIDIGFKPDVKLTDLYIPAEIIDIYEVE